MEYKVLATSITTQLGLRFSQNDIVTGDKFGEHLEELIAEKAIKEFNPEIEEDEEIHS